MTRRQWKYRKRLMGETWLVLARFQCRPLGTKGKMLARHNLRRRIKQIMALDSTGDISRWLDIDLILPDEMYSSYLFSLDGGEMPALIDLTGTPGAKNEMD